MIYLDYQATTPLAPEALDAMLPWLRDGHANPHSAHRPGRVARAAVEVAREQVAALLPPGGRVAFTSGATEALNWAIKGTAGPIVTLSTEHAAVLDTVAAQGRVGRQATVLPVGKDGLADLTLVTPALSRGLASSSSQTADGPRRDAGVTGNSGMVAAMLVNNEIGVIQPIAALADLAQRVGALFLCDAVQGYGRVPIPDNVDLVAISAHKIHGPKGIGALWIRDGVRLDALLHGGDQEGGRSGTLSPALCAGFGVAARLMRERAEEDGAHIRRLCQVATDRLDISAPPAGDGRPNSPLPLAGGPGGGDATTVLTSTPASGSGASSGRGVSVSTIGDGWLLNGAAAHRYPGNLNIRRDGLDVARLMSDCRDIAFSAGSACASGSGRPSHVLRALGLTGGQARSSIRLGFGRYTTQGELADALDRIDAAARAQRIAA